MLAFKFVTPRVSRSARYDVVRAAAFLSGLEEKHDFAHLGLVHVAFRRTPVPREWGMGSGPQLCMKPARCE